MSLDTRNKRPSFLKLASLTVLIGALIAACSGPPPEPPPGPPAAPSNVTATPGPGYMTVAWTDNSDDETGFEVYRTSSAAATSSRVTSTQSTLLPQQNDEPLATLPPDATSYVDLAVELNTAYDYEVVAVGSEGASEGAAALGPATVEPGVDLLVGTVDRVYDEENTGTVFIVYLVFDEAVLLDPNVEISVTLTGPPGWNQDDALSGPVPLSGLARQNGFARNQLHEIDSIAGIYTLTAVVDGVTYEATAELMDPAHRHGRPSDVTVSVSADETEVMTNWTPVSDAVTTYARIHKNNFEQLLYQTVAVDTATFSGLSLDEGIYLIEIMSMNADLVNYPVKTEPFGLSSNFAVFGIGNPQSDLCGSPSEVIEIPDVALLEAVRSSLGKPSGAISCVEMTTLEGVWAANAAIESLEGLQYADNLKWVELGENNLVSSVEPLRDLEFLEDVSLWGSPLADASPLAGKTTIQGIDFGGTELTDFSFLNGMVSLESLHLWNLDGIDKSPLHDLTQLRWLSLSGTGLTDAEAAFLEDLVDPVALWLEWNELTSLAPLVANPGLGAGDEVWVHHNFLDLEDPDVMADVQTLLDRGVILEYEEQEDLP